MIGRAEVARLKQRLDATFARARIVGTDPELQSDFAKYLCILVSGYLEQSAAELVSTHARNTGGPTLQRYVGQQTKRFTNANTQKLQNLLGDFDTDWQVDLQKFVVDDLKDAVDSVIALRNKIAHGESVGLTNQTISDYYSRVQTVIEKIADICDPI